MNENPEQTNGSRKVYADLFIDDLALGVPLLPGIAGGKPFVNWPAVARLLRERN